MRRIQVKLEKAVQFEAGDPVIVKVLRDGYSNDFHGHVDCIDGNEIIISTDVHYSIEGGRVEIVPCYGFTGTVLKDDVELPTMEDLAWKGRI